MEPPGNTFDFDKSGSAGKRQGPLPCSLQMVWYMYGARSSRTKVLLQRALCRKEERKVESRDQHGFYHVVLHVIDVRH